MLDRFSNTRNTIAVSGDDWLSSDTLKHIVVVQFDGYALVLDQLAKTGDREWEFVTTTGKKNLE